MFFWNSAGQYDLVPLREEGSLIPQHGPQSRRVSSQRSCGSCLIPIPIFTLLLVGIFVITFVTSSASTIFQHSLFRPAYATSKHPLTVLISSADSTIGELDYWIHSILSHLVRPIDVQVIPSKHLKLLDDSIILAFNDLQKWTELKARSSFQNVGLLRIGDEYGNDTSYEHYSYVFRPYWFDYIYNRGKDNAPVLWIPNGYATGVGPRLSSTLLAYSQRPQLCYFEGSPKDNGHVSSREKMRQSLMKWDPNQEACQVRWTDDFMRGQTALMYSASLGRAKYALCPAGNSGETIRFYEALENNSIPIVVYEPWMTGAFGKDAEFPFIVLNTWDELGPRLEALVAEHPSIGQARQMASREWWERTQNAVRSAALRLVDESFNKKVYLSHLGR
jgi:hypothetical protein